MGLLLFETIQRESVISFPGLGNLTLNPPAYFTIFGRTIYFYGVLIALGFLLATLYCARHAPDFGLKPDDFYDLMLWLIPLSILGARAYFVLFRWGDYAAAPLRVFAVWEGGLAIYGGIIAAVITIFAVCRVKKISALALLDLVAFGLLIGQLIGRWGNFMNREAFGYETDIFCRMGLTLNGETIYVHPTFLYESLWNLVGFVCLHILSKKLTRKFDGQIFLTYLAWYGLGRVWIEGLRTDSLYIGGTGIRVSQLLAGVLFVGCTAALILLMRNKKLTPEKLWVNRVAAASNAEAEEETTPASEETETDAEDHIEKEEPHV